jgi:hypothetical protein
MKWCVGRGNFVIRILGIKHGKPVVVFGGEYHVLHPGGAGRGGPFLWSKFHRIEGIL